MADIALTAAQIAAVFPDDAEIIDFVAAEAITAGQAVYQASTGKVSPTNAGAAGTAQFRGIALKAAAAGQAVSILKRGQVYGFTLTGVAYDAPVYLSNTAGALSTTVGTVTVKTGRVIALPDSNLTKVLFVAARYEEVWA